MSSPAVDRASGAGARLDSAPRLPLPTWGCPMNLTANSGYPPSNVLPPVKELGEMAVGANVKVVAIGNAKAKGSPDRRVA